MSILDPVFNKIPTGWEELFESQEETFHRIKLILKEDNCTNIVPEPKDTFRVFDMILPENIKVIIIGQDPYPEPGVANGIAFSTHPDNPIPRSLSNIFKEISRCYPHLEKRDNGDLTDLVLQGVFLLNTSLTRNIDISSCSDQHFNKKIWLPFIIAAITYIKSKNRDVLFVCWGKSAKETLKSCGFRKIEDSNLFESGHPSPLAAGSKDPFTGCGHFLAINERLQELGWNPVEW